MPMPVPTPMGLRGGHGRFEALTADGEVPHVTGLLGDSDAGPNGREEDEEDGGQAGETGPLQADSAKPSFLEQAATSMVGTEDSPTALGLLRAKLLTLERERAGEAASLRAELAAERGDHVRERGALRAELAAEARQHAQDRARLSSELRASRPSAAEMRESAGLRDELAEAEVALSSAEKHLATQREESAEQLRRAEVKSRLGEADLQGRLYATEALLAGRATAVAEEEWQRPQVQQHSAELFFGARPPPLGPPAGPAAVGRRQRAD